MVFYSPFPPSPAHLPQGPLVSSSFPLRQWNYGAPKVSRVSGRIVTSLTAFPGIGPLIVAAVSHQSGREVSKGFSQESSTGAVVLSSARAFDVPGSDAGFPHFLPGDLLGTGLFWVPLGVRAHVLLVDPGGITTHTWLL